MKAQAVVTPEKTASRANLVYVSDDKRGYTRHRAGKGFFYRNTRGQKIANKTQLDRIKALVIPPAWEDVWICPKASGHLQATGRDERGRKQYRYHDEWQQAREEAKFDRVLAFGKALPKLRRTVSRVLRQGDPFEHRTVVATVVRLLDQSLIRVGNEQYADENKTRGLTTMRERDTEVDGKQIHFSFKAKGGIQREVSVRDPLVVDVIRELQELPGQRLFQYRNSEGKRKPVRSDDINAFIQEVTGEAFTAKDFRTWAGTVLAAVELAEKTQAGSDRAIAKDIVAAVKAVSACLGNTPAVCRKSYIHPGIPEAYKSGTLAGLLTSQPGKALQSAIRGLRADEVAVMVCLHQLSKHS